MNYSGLPIHTQSMKLIKFWLRISGNSREKMHYGNVVNIANYSIWDCDWVFIGIPLPNFMPHESVYLKAYLVGILSFWDWSTRKFKLLRNDFYAKSDVVAGLRKFGEFWGSTTDFQSSEFATTASCPCILSIITGKLECDEYTTEDSLYIAKILAEINSQIGAKV